MCPGLIGLLAYVFWHTRRAGVAAPAYERALTAFHEALIGAAPPGLVTSAAHRIEGAPWLRGEDGYEDWYVVDSWEALGTLNEAAVDARRRQSHDALADGVAAGVGGVYALRAGAPAVEQTQAVAWLEKPRGVPYRDFRDRVARLVEEGGGVWERQLVLGPAPEYCVVTDRAQASASLAATVVTRRAVFAAGDPSRRA